MSRCCSFSLLPLSFSLSRSLFLSRFFFPLHRRIEFQYHFLFIILFSFLFSSLYICLRSIIAVRQPSPNKRVHDARRVLFFSLSCYWCSITNFSLFLHARTSPPLPTLGSEQKRLIKVRINTSLVFFSFARRLRRSRSLALYAHTAFLFHSTSSCMSSNGMDN